MAQAALRHIAFSLATVSLLVGCVEGAGPGAETGATRATLAPAKAGSGRDIEAPEVFQTTDTALWDGRPSLGGIWVASPNVTDPERVVMFNPATGKTVTGALFRRERDNPGPTLQMSSDAAEALGMLAGQPAQIRVTALRREEVKAPAPEPAVAEKPEAGAPEDAGAKPDADAAATAAAATAALAAADPAKAAPAGDAQADAGAEAAEAAPARKTWKERRAEAKAARDAKKAAAAAATVAAAEGTAPADAAETATATATAESAAVAAVETAPLDARGPAAADPASQPEPPKTRKQKRAEEAAAAATAAAAAAETSAPPPAVAAATGRPIQVASFSQEENAKRAVEALAKIGVSARPQKSETNGKVVWGVVALGDAAMLAAIKSAGFADAYFLK